MLLTEYSGEASEKFRFLASRGSSFSVGINRMNRRGMLKFRVVVGTRMRNFI